MDGAKKLLEDLSIAVVRLYVEDRLQKTSGGIDGVRVFATDSLAAVRYAREVDKIRLVTTCNENEMAAEYIEQTVDAEGVLRLVEIVQDKATMALYCRRKHCDHFDVIDLGDRSPCTATLFDPAMNAIANGGLLLVTCSDLTISTGKYPETCYREYGAVSLKMCEEYRCDEFTLRVLLKCIESHANRHGRYIVPLLSVSAGCSARIFVKVFISPVACKQSLSKLSWVYQCNGCFTPAMQPLGVADKKEGIQKNVFKFSLPRGPPVDKLCPHCSHTFKVGGPIWSAPINCPVYVSRLQRGEHSAVVSEVLRNVLSETHQACLYFTEAQLSAVVAGHDMTRCAEDVRMALMNAGFKVSCSHVDKTSLKTDAPSGVVWDMVCCWVRAQHGPQLAPSTMDKPAANILAQPSHFHVDFATQR